MTNLLVVFGALVVFGDRMEGCRANHCQHHCMLKREREHKTKQKALQYSRETERERERKKKRKESNGEIE